ncbi:MAG: phosphofructokinase, partial [Alphaproteobacteria bacterium HGW-Alphaproteobacteria-5]
GVWRATAPAVEVVSAVGAGDSFLAAMVMGLASGFAPEEAFRRGVAAGSAALLSPGTELCRAEDVERLMREVRAEKI